jgi:hypothetical protein
MSKFGLKSYELFLMGSLMCIIEQEISDRSKLLYLGDNIVSLRRMLLSKSKDWLARSPKITCPSRATCLPTLQWDRADMVY